MSSDLTHEELQELLGVYALDAVEADERATVEEHLTECPQCRAEVAEHLETAAMLASAGAPAPDGIWDRIALELEPEVVPLRRPSRRPATRWLAAAAAAAIVASMLVLSGSVLRQQEDIDRLAAAVEDASVARAANLALLHPDARRATLASGGPVSAEAVMLPDGSGFILADTLHEAPAGRTYQLWAISDGRPISAGVIGRDPDVTAFTADAGTEVLAITEEVAGGASQPTADPIVSGDVVEA